MCYTFVEKLFFSTNIILWKKVILNCLKINIGMCCKKGWCVRLRQEGGSLREREGIAWNAVKGIGIEKRGVETKILKGGGKRGNGGGALEGRGWNPI